MAKNSFILGTTRGSVGNLVVRRTNGQTIISAKPASVSNPRTYAQAENRMRLAAVSKFYSPLAQVLEQGVQGKNTLDSQAEFSSFNIRLMREQGLGWPKQSEFGPMPFRLTKGSVPSVGAKVTASDIGGDANDNHFTLPYALPGDSSREYTTIGDFANYLQGALGLSVSRFQVTFVCVVGRQIVEERTEVFEPRAFRVEVSTASTTPISSVLPAWVPLVASVQGGDPGWTFNVSGHLLGAAVIISYYDGRKWVRSTEYLHVCPDWLEVVRANYEQYVASFMDSAEVTDPDGRVYLDGYTRGASGGGGGGGEGYDYDPSIYKLQRGTGSSAATITQRAVAVVPVDLSGTQVVGLLLDDDSTAVLSGNIQLNTYGKAFNYATKAQITLTSEQQATMVWPARESVVDGDYYDFYAWVADELGWPITALINA